MSLKHHRSWCVRTCALLLLLLSSHAASGQTPSPWTGVIRDDAEQATGAFAGFSSTGQRAMSADGRFLVFESNRTLVAGDTNGTFDIFVRDRQTGALERVSVATDGTEGDGLSQAPAISANGRHVVFLSQASNLDPTDTNGVSDLYVRDLDTGMTSLVTIGPSGERLNCTCSRPVARLSGTTHPATVEAAEFMRERGEEWLRASGCEKVWSAQPGLILSGRQHQAGTCRMGIDPKTSVTDEWGRVHNHDNLFVVDGSLHVTNGGFNPVLTIMALAFRSGEYIAGQL